MNSITKILITLFLSLLLTACGGSDSKDKDSSGNNNGLGFNNPAANNSNNDNSDNQNFNTSDVKINDEQYFLVKSPKECTVNNQNKFVYEVLHDSYLWSNEVATVDSSTNNYDSPEKVLKALKSANDKFSFILDQKTAQSYFEQGRNEDFGFGLQMVKVTNTTFGLAITHLYPDAPAQKAGLKRGEVITKINNLEILEENIDKLVEILENNSNATFTIITEITVNNSIRTKDILLSKANYSINPVLYTNVYVNKNKTSRVAYMVFQDFLDTATTEVNRVFNSFKVQNVTDMILDLRYNGGGSVDIANHLASLIGGENVKNTVLHHVKFNQKYSRFNEVTKFEDVKHTGLNLKRVFVLTTKKSCSASELVINALKSSTNEVEVVQIGGTTCGKPYGFAGSGVFCQKALFAINMETTNGNDNGAYVNGLQPDCPLEDDLFKEFGDTSEGLLASALSYIETGKCSTTNKQTINKQMKISKSFELPQDGFRRMHNAY